MKSSSNNTVMSIHQLEVVLTRKPIKNLILRVTREGQVNISAPRRCSMKTIEAFLLQKKDWVIKQQQQAQEQPIPKTMQLITGEQQIYLGRAYTVLIHETTTSPNIRLQDHQLLCFFKTSMKDEQKHVLMTAWYRQQMKALLPPLFEKWEAIIGVKTDDWGVKAMKTRWGSCNTRKKRIWLNLHLIHHPLICLEYVLVHELVHLLEPSHNKRFYQLMGQFMPAWKEHKQLLEKHTLKCT